MNKVGRNDPCPCGSGKKYKKCHGASNVIDITPTRYNTELERLHVGLIEFACTEYEQELSTIFNEYPQLALMEDEEGLDFYLSGLTAWATLYEPIHHDQTIFDIYYKRQQSKINHERVKKAFASWSAAIPSIFEILSVTEEKIYVQDVRTENEYQIAVHEENDFEEGHFVMGILLPFLQQHEFLFTAFELFDVTDEMMNTIEALSDEEMIEDYPDILGEALTMEDVPAEVEWDHPLYETVADIFLTHAIEKDANEGVVTIGVLIWKRFTEEVGPTIKKPQAYAAALEYVLQHHVFDHPFQSQKDLADEYGTSPTTISNHSKKIIEVLGDEIDDMIEDLMDIMEEEAGPESLNHPSITMEKTLNDLQRVLNEQEFDTKEEAEEFIAKLIENQGLMEPAALSPRDRAQDKLFEAYQAKGAERNKLIKEALDIYPNSPDAYIIKAEDAKTINEKYQLYNQAVVVGKKDLGEAFFKENIGHFWLMTETRPFMRAKAELANVQYQLGDITSATANYQELLELNPGDNMGVRYNLLTLYLETGQYEEAKALIDEYEDDIDANMQFNHALLHFLTDGFTSQTESLLKEADKVNPHVKDYLTGNKSVPKRTPNYIGIGDEMEAIAYVQENGHLWQEALPLVAELNKL